MWSALGLTVVHSRQFHFTNFQQSFFWEDLGKGIQQLDSHQVDPKYLKIKIDFQPSTDAKPPFMYLHLLVEEMLDVSFDFDENGGWVDQNHLGTKSYFKKWFLAAQIIEYMAGFQLVQPQIWDRNPLCNRFTCWL